MKSYFWSKKNATKDKKPTADQPNPEFDLRNLGLNAGWAYSSGSTHRAYDINDTTDGKKGLTLRAHRKMKVLALNDGVPNPSHASAGSGKPSNWILLGCKKVDGDGNKIEKKDRMTIYIQHLSPGFTKGDKKIKKGDIVFPGQKIANMGITGNTSGPHLHCAVMWGWVDRSDDRYLYLSKGDSSGKNKGYGSVVWGKKMDNLLRLNKNRKAGNGKANGW